MSKFRSGPCFIGSPLEVLRRSVSCARDLVRAPLIQPASENLSRSFQNGAVAQLGERLICIQEVAGSIPTSSTSFTNSDAPRRGPVAQVVRAHP